MSKGGNESQGEKGMPKDIKACNGISKVCQWESRGIKTY